MALIKKADLDGVRTRMRGAAVVIGAQPEDAALVAKKEVFTTKQKKALLQKLASGALQSTALDRERVFDALYAGDGASGALKPPYDPDMCYRLVEENNTLQPCIDAMMTNIDGTGHEIVPHDDYTEEEVDDAIREKCDRFFKNVWPGCSFTTLRRQIRRDVEVTGNGYIEVIRNLAGDVAFMRRMDPGITRMMRYDDRTFDEKVYSEALEAEVVLRMRRRRYVQFSFGKLVYFKEFGATAELDSVTGKWKVEAGEVTNSPYEDQGAAGSYTPQGASTPFERANEVLHFTCIRHHEVPYGFPRWVTQSPSVVGSRKAEEFNVGFFDAGGIPPLLMIVQGDGATAEEAETALKNMFYSKGPHKNIAAVLHVSGMEGSIDKPSPTKVTVERFGSERQKDAMFDVYDKSCTEKIRRAFRLPALFIGDIADATYASALASYRVAESQVFKPERDEFDEVINATLMKALLGDDADTVCFRSLPVTAKDMEQALLAVTTAGQAGWIDPDEAVSALNEITGMDMEPAEEPGAYLPQIQQTDMVHEHEAEQASAAQDFAAGQQESTQEHTSEESQASRDHTSEEADKSREFQAEQAAAAQEAEKKKKKKPVPAGKSYKNRYGKRRFVRKPIQRQAVRKFNDKPDILDVMVQVAANVCRNNRKGSQDAFDCIAFVERLDPVRRELFGVRLGHSILDVGPGEEVSAARIAMNSLKDAAK